MSQNSPFNQTQVFEQAHVRRAFDRAAESYEQFAILQNEVTSSCITMPVVPRTLAPLPKTFFLFLLVATIFSFVD